LRLCKIYILTGIVAIFLSPTVFANGGDPFARGRADVYMVSLSQFQIDNGEGSTPVTASGSATLDIAAASGVTGSAGNFFSGLIIPDGSYSRVRPTPSGTFTVTGSVTYDGTTYYTEGSQSAGGGCVTKLTAPAEACTVTISVPTPDWESLGGTLTVTDGNPDYKVRVSFNTGMALGLYDGVSGKEIWPQEPNPLIQLLPVE